MEYLCGLITENKIGDLEKGILERKVQLSIKNKEDLVKHAAEHGHSQCLKILVDSGYPVSNGWDSPLKPAAAKGIFIVSL